jgi:hypothetical protein
MPLCNQLSLFWSIGRTMTDEILLWIVGVWQTKVLFETVPMLGE